MPTALQTPPVSQNHLLAAIPLEELDRITPHFVRVPLVFNETLFNAGDTIECVYFPLNGLISIVSTMEDGGCVEVGMCGNEGMSGISVVLGDNISSHHRGVVQATGSALKLSAIALREELRRDGALRSVLLRYVHFTLAQATQSAACNRLHSLEQRCARWLLSTRDRVGADSFPITHEFLSYMLGVRRPGVTVAIHALEQAGLIQNSHRQMTILDSEGLEAASCECHRVLKGELARLLE
jgi:CRP-like cAMP-binding protein